MYIEMSLKCLEMTCHMHNVRGISGRGRITGPYSYYMHDVVLFPFVMDKKE